MHEYGTNPFLLWESSTRLLPTHTWQFQKCLNPSQHSPKKNCMQPSTIQLQGSDQQVFHRLRTTPTYSAHLPKMESDYPLEHQLSSFCIFLQLEPKFCFPPCRVTEVLAISPCLSRWHLNSSTCTTNSSTRMLLVYEFVVFSIFLPASVQSWVLLPWFLVWHSTQNAI